MGNGFIQIPGYEILRPLGAGGMSTVYLALQRSLDRTVAIKVMRRGVDAAAADAAQGEKRFLLEGRMMAKLPHRNIVAVYDIVSNEDIAYIAMEYLGGGALTDRMRTGIALADAIAVIVQIAGALEFAHEHGVVHRDLKPANIMFRDSGTPVLTDFGIARYQDGSATRLTQTGMLVGTPTYMSPEQINGLQVDGRADQYSLGILFYELLTGAPPFRGDTPIAVLMAHLTQAPAPLPAEFAAFQDIFDRVLAKNRDERYATLKAFSDDLKSRLVHSDTLLMRLQLDPNQTSSEQLRALGFYTSTPSSGGLRASLSGQHPIPTVAAPTPDAASASAPTPGLRKWWPAVAAIGAVLVLVVLWGLFGHRRLSHDEQELVNLWNDRAAELIKSGQLVVAAPGSDGSALDFVHKVEQKDPGNSRAVEARAQIGKLLAAQGDAALAGKRIGDAEKIDVDALKALPGDASLVGLQQRIAQAREQVRAQVQADAQAADTRHKAQAQVATLLDSGTDPELRAAFDGITQLLTQDAADADTQALRARAVAAMGKRLQSAAGSEDFDALAGFVKGRDATWANDPAWAGMLHDMSAWRAKIVADAQAQAAANAGELLLNATPWARVDAVADGSGRAVTLPEDSSTPLLLKLPAGTYSVVFRQPLDGKSKQLTVSIEGQKRATLSASFAAPDAKEYFKHAGL
ncbi:MAG TPA: serine/threonine-protein kinase [Rudaea sp.]|nr:serine/threonine-protein kinase [Rudaea sp.]